MPNELSKMINPNADIGLILEKNRTLYSDVK